MPAPLPQQQTLYRVVGRTDGHRGLGRREVWLYRRHQDAQGRVETLRATGGKVERFDVGEVDWRPMPGWGS